MPDQMIPNPNMPRDRYRSFPHNPPQQSEEVYDFIAEPPHGPLSRAAARSPQKQQPGLQEDLTPACRGGH